MSYMRQPPVTENKKSGMWSSETAASGWQVSHVSGHV